MINLTEKQAAALPVIEQLLDPFAYRGSGRTTLMIIAFVNLALRYPGHRIQMFDHVNEFCASEQYFREQIHNTLSRIDNPDLQDLHFDALHLTLEYRPVFRSPAAYQIGVDKAKKGSDKTIKRHIKKA